VTLNRPEIHNAFNEQVIADLTNIFQEQVPNATADIKCVILTGNGKSFSAGAAHNQGSSCRAEHVRGVVMSSEYSWPDASNALGTWCLLYRC
jgi:enoyl-CoA hydratase/carnithine racemase